MAIRTSRFPDTVLVAVIVVVEIEEGADTTTGGAVSSEVEAKVVSGTCVEGCASIVVAEDDVRLPADAGWSCDRALVETG